MSASHRPALYALDVARGGVHRVDTETGEVSDIVTGVLAAPDGIVVDEERGCAYVTLMGAPDAPLGSGAEPPFTRRNGAVVRVPLAGGAVEEVVPSGSFTTGKQLTTDAATGRLYWADREGHGIYRAERDGSDVTALVLTEGHGPSEAEEQCVGVAVDAESGHLYWTQKGPADAGRGRILRAGLEIPAGETAADRSDVETLWSGLPEPIDLELDLGAGVLYWSDRGVGPTGNTLNRAPIPAPGETGAEPEVLARGFHEAIGVALDAARGLVYVSDLSGEIREVDLRGGSERVIATLAGSATGIAIGS